MTGPVWSVALPAGAEPPLEVYVNGAPCREGVDYVVEGRWLRFSRPLASRPGRRLGLGGRALLSAGIGVYGDAPDTVDIRYRAGGAWRAATGLPVVPPIDDDV